MGCEAPQGVNSCSLAHGLPQLSEFVKGHLLHFSPGDSQCTGGSEKLCGKETALTLIMEAHPNPSWCQLAGRNVFYFT